MTRLYANNASSTLASGVNNTDDPVALTIQPGDGSIFPPITGSDTFLVTVEDETGAIEIMLATDITNDVITAERAQEGTVALTFPSGARVENRITAGTVADFVAQGESLDMGGSTLSNASVTSSAWNGGTMQAGTYFGTSGDPSNAITVPNDGSNPNVNGDAIVLQSNIGTGVEADAIYKNVYPVGIVTFFATSVNPNTTAPAGVTWQEVTAAYDRFLRFSPSGQAGSTAPAVTETGQAGAHAHGGFVLGTSLDVGQLPPHNHPIDFNQNVVLRVGTGLDVGGTGGGVANPPSATGFTGLGLPHDHVIEQDGEHTHSMSPTPASYALVPWQRTA